QRAVDKWNRTIEKSGATELRLRLPHRRFHRHIGLYAGLPFDIDGNLVDTQGDWLPSEADKTYVASLMRPGPAPGQIAAWIAPPGKGINGKPFDFPYVISR